MSFIRKIAACTARPAGRAPVQATLRRWDTCTTGAPNVIGQTIGNAIAGNIEQQANQAFIGSGQATPVPGGNNPSDNGTYAPSGPLTLPNGQAVDWVDYTATSWDSKGSPTAGHFDYYGWNDATNSDDLVFSRQTSTPQFDGTDYTATAFYATGAPRQVTLDSYVWDDLTGSDVQYNSVSESSSALIRSAIPQSIALSAQGANSTALSEAQRSDLTDIASLLSGGTIGYNFNTVPNQPLAAAAAGMRNGVATITINPQVPGLYNDDGSINLLTLGADVTHEGQHLLDDVNFKWSNGPTTLPQERLTEQNAYAAQSYFDLATNNPQNYIIAGKLVPLTPASAGQVAELSVTSWFTASNIAIARTNAANAQATNAYNQKWGTHIVAPYTKPMQWIPPSK